MEPSVVVTQIQSTKVQAHAAEELDSGAEPQPDRFSPGEVGNDDHIDLMDVEATKVDVPLPAYMCTLPAWCFYVEYHVHVIILAYTPYHIHDAAGPSLFVLPHSAALQLTSCGSCSAALDIAMGESELCDTGSFCSVEPLVSLNDVGPFPPTAFPGGQLDTSREKFAEPPSDSLMQLESERQQQTDHPCRFPPEGTPTERCVPPFLAPPTSSHVVSKATPIRQLGGFVMGFAAMFEKNTFPGELKSLLSMQASARWEASCLCSVDHILISLIRGQLASRS